MIMSKHRWLILLLTLLLCRIILLFVFPLSDPSEARYAAITANMAASGNYLEPKLMHNGVMQNFDGKPPLYFQSGGVSCELFGTSLFAVRLPAFLSALCILWCVYYTVKRLRSEQTAFAAVFFCLLSPVFFAFAGLCMTDLMLAAAVTLSVCAYMLFTAEDSKIRKKIYSVLFFAGLGTGMMVKGPVALVMAGMGIFIYLVWNRKFGELKNHAWLTGIATFLLISVPWYYLMTMKNPDFPEYFFVNENFKRFIFKEYGDKYGSGRETFRGMALVWFTLVNLPSVLLLTWPLRNREKRNKFFARDIFSDPLEGFSALTVITITLFWCLTSRVLITYLLPTIPFFAIFLASRLEKNGFFEEKTFCRTVRYGIAAIAALLAVSFAAISFAAPHFADKMPVYFYAGLQQKAADGMLANAKFYFVRETPYSAGFYLGSRVANHPKEIREISISRGQDHILIARKRDIAKAPELTKGKILFQAAGWTAYRPGHPAAEKESN